MCTQVVIITNINHISLVSSVCCATTRKPQASFDPSEPTAYQTVSLSATTNKLEMITDGELYRLAIFLGSAAMILIILYHFFEINANEDEGKAVQEKAADKAPMEKTSKSPTLSAATSTKQR
ncbi:uncharacterized protein CTHT_0005630 [Thermochaetoides thermophila DSM 1495]|uniref:Dolichyl-diphosphooligosaccharide--protein glycosyltransferase subunit 4 n=1 Tax=Chaetomium thermophilum (strain DSM 1495 / CBS 144.50 / IMI 039719) TaxID=759272 RepID=G0RY69_CHATD|nr:hypothetical protein CTHT_0005630 [Thermochaetoides thermophila DSM 1495]EGS23855.1 hypothetical protein CTHT_0005630 [Thermochaetoides thermophila DSM 1495]